MTPAVLAPSPFSARYGPWAVVTGASQGIGLAFAHALAARRVNVVLLARASDRLEAATAAVAARGVAAQSLAVDLSKPGLLDVLAPIADRDVGLVVCNAVVGGVGAFLDQPLAHKLAQIDVNVRAPLLLAHHFAPRLVARGRGGLVMVSSASALAGTALVANYAATKAYDHVLGEGLWAELAPRGVDVLAVAPGMTETPGFRSSNPGRLAAPPMTADAVATEALDALGRGPSLISGRLNRVAMGMMHALLPRGAIVRMLARTMREMYGDR